jgi:hypothetical protein
MAVGGDTDIIRVMVRPDAFQSQCSLSMPVSHRDGISSRAAGVTVTRSLGLRRRCLSTSKSAPALPQYLKVSGVTCNDSDVADRVPSETGGAGFRVVDSTQAMRSRKSLTDTVKLLRPEQN